MIFDSGLTKEIADEFLPVWRKASGKICSAVCQKWFDLGYDFAEYNDIQIMKVELRTSGDPGEVVISQVTHAIFYMDTGYSETEFHAKFVIPIGADDGVIEETWIGERFEAEDTLTDQKKDQLMKVLDVPEQKPDPGWSFDVEL